MIELGIIKQEIKIGCLFIELLRLASKILISQSRGEEVISIFITFLPM